MAFIPTGGSHFSLPKPMQQRWRNKQYRQISRFSRKATGTLKQGARKVTGTVKLVARKANGGLKEAASKTTGIVQSVVNFFTGKGAQTAKTQKRRRRHSGRS